MGSSGRRRHLGVVLLLDGDSDREVRGLRRALGSPSLERIPPHVTLVPPVNVRIDDLGTAMDVLRAAADTVAPFTVTVGPVATFHPVTPVLYLAVSTDDVSLTGLAAACASGPLERRTDRPFVPHVTVHEEAPDELVSAGMVALASYRRDVHVERIWVLEHGDDRVWRPFADVELGPHPARILGGVGVVVRTAVAVAPDVAALVGERAVIEGRVVHEAFADGVLAGAAVSASAPNDVRLVEALEVVPALRRRGVGRRLLDAVAEAARDRDERTLRAPASDGTDAVALARSAGFGRRGDLWERKA